MEDRYIHSVTTQTDENEGTHIIVTVNPELAKLALEALWIMVDTTFAVVHDTTPILISDDEADISGPSQMPALNLFPGLRPMTPITEPRSDFDYQAALNSDIMDHTFKSIIRDHPVDSDDEVIASDPYPVYH
ncbi:hypothetical protein K438DRAFT_1970327 [Mycena galopus ATCC 62051]|nr:hypothetical protein K438DRAFT_1970327 [Mycena galopus ATCC 62051]